MTLRPAKHGDEQFFFHLREQAEKSNPNYEGQPVEWVTHRNWFTRRIISTPPTLFVWTIDGIAKGCARIEPNGEVVPYTLPERMRSLLAELEPHAVKHGGRLKLTLDPDDPLNDAVQEAGWAEYPVRFYCYRP